MDQQCKSVYEETFYIIPRRIRKLPGITLAFLDIYETIFQFWNKQLPCYLSNKTIEDRTGVGHSQARAALAFFESNGELERKIINGRRYLVQPVKQIETDCINSEDAAPSAPPCRSSGPPPAAPSAHNIKKDTNKEKELVVCGEPPTTQQSQKEKVEHEALTNQKNIELFNKKFSDRDVTLEEIFKGCQSFNAQKNRWVDSQLFNKWLLIEKPDNYAKKGSHAALKKQNGMSDQVKYSNFVGDIKAQINLGLKPQDTVIPSFEAWSAQSA